MKAYEINARKIHITKHKCIECGEEYKWGWLEGVSLPVCPSCRQKGKEEWEERNATQTPLFDRRKI